MLTRTLGRLTMAIATVMAMAAGAAQADLVILQSVQNDRFAGFGDGGVLAATEIAPRAQRFELIRLQGNRVALRDPASGRYLRTGAAQGGLLSLGDRGPGVWESFALGRFGTDQTLQSIGNGKYLRVGTGDKALIGAVSDRIGGPERFRLVEVAAHAMTGTWQVTEITLPGGQPIRVNDIALSRARFTMEPDGRFSMTAGCNRLGGTIRRRGDLVDVSGIFSTRMMCNTPAFRIEQRFAEALAIAARVTVRAQTMTLEDAAGLVLLTFRRL